MGGSLKILPLGELLSNSYGLTAYTPGNEIARVRMSPLFSE